MKVITSYAAIVHTQFERVKILTVVLTLRHPRTGLNLGHSLLKGSSDSEPLSVAAALFSRP